MHRVTHVKKQRLRFMVDHLSTYGGMVLTPDPSVSHEVGFASGKPSATEFDIEKTWTILHTTQRQRMSYGQPSFQVPWKGLMSEPASLSSLSSASPPGSLPRLDSVLKRGHPTPSAIDSWTQPRESPPRTRSGDAARTSALPDTQQGLQDPPHPHPEVPLLL